jgi:hypothetical protein
MTAWASVSELRAYLPQESDLGLQSVTLAGATGGTFTLSYEGATTAALAYNATATVVQTALQGLSGLSSSAVKVTGRPGGPYLVSFQGVLVSDAGPLSGDAALLTGVVPTITIASALDDVLGDVLERATDTIRQALRAALADPTFDYAAYSSASTMIVRGYTTQYLRIPSHQAGSVTLVEYQSASNPVGYTEVADEVLEEGAQLYRAAGWGPQGARYRITAIWGWGPDAPPAAVEIVLEQAVNIWRSKDKGGFSENIGVEGSGAIRLVTGLTKPQQATIAALRDQLIDIAI